MKKLSTILLAGTLFLAACGGGKKDPQKELQDLLKQRTEIDKKIHDLEAKLGKKDSSDKSKLINVDSVRLTEFKHYIDVQGSVDADDNIWVTSIGGIVTSVKVSEGDRVSAGQILATTDAAALEKALEEARNGLSLATTVYEKQKRLWDQNIGSEIQYLQAKNNKENVEKTVQRLQAQLNMTQMRSPINGVVDEIKVRLGEMAAPGTPWNGIRIVNTSKLKVRAKLADSELGKIKEGDKVAVDFPDLNKQIETTIKYVGKVVNAQSRTFNVEADIAGAENNLSPNMIAKMLINDKILKDVMVVPSNIVQRSVEGNYVLVALKNGDKYEAHKKPVITGMEYNGQTVIESGLTPGDLIITFGYSELVDGESIRF